MVVKAAEQDKFFQKSLPIEILNNNFLCSNYEYSCFKSNLKDILNQLTNDQVIENSVNEMNRNLLLNTSPLPDGHFSEINKIDSIDLDTIVRIREGVLSKVKISQDVSEIQFSGNMLSGPNYLQSVFRLVDSLQEFTVRDISGNLSDKDKIDLVRRLIKEGLLKTVAATSES